MANDFPGQGMDGVRIFAALEASTGAARACVEVFIVPCLLSVLERLVCVDLLVATSSSSEVISIPLFIVTCERNNRIAETLRRCRFRSERGRRIWIEGFGFRMLKMEGEE